MLATKTHHRRRSSAPPPFERPDRAGVVSWRPVAGPRITRWGWLIGCWCAWWVSLPAGQALHAAVDPATLARQVTIHRDPWGVPHIEGPTDEAVLFGFAYAQCQDYFWQVEDTYILALGRYAEVHGPRGVNRDLLNRAFEIPQASAADFPQLNVELRSAIEAFTAGLNWYLAQHPEVRPRLITRFEPWHVLAYGRHLLLEMGFRYTHLPNSGSTLPGKIGKISAHKGSNAWAIAPERTRDGHALLFINPHQPWFGFGQFCEVHLKSGEGWNFSGATFFGNPMPALGHNEHLGWAFTVNEPDIADAWRVTFDKPDDPLAYRWGDGYRQATQWQDTLRVLTSRGMRDEVYTFRKTHHGPCVVQESEQVYLAANVAKLHESLLMGQMLQMVRAQNLAEFKAAMGLLNFQFMNTVYADRDGNIYYLYNAAVPRRDPRFRWDEPVDGSDPRTDWRGYHALAELPQCENPPSGFLQSCNATPFAASDDGSPARNDFPSYMVEEKDEDKRRSKVSRMLLRAEREWTFELLEERAFDTTIYWALTELPRLAEEFRRLERRDPRLHAAARPYFEHLLDWDCRGTLESTQATLCVAWYEELYGAGYPAETLGTQFQLEPKRKFQALIQAANKVAAAFGRWRVPFGEVNRIQRHADVADFIEVPFSDTQPSLPCAGLPGPLGVVFTNYYTPTIKIPLVRTVKKHYGVVGATYLAVLEFGPRIRGSTLLQFGQSGDPRSPHFFDQARLLSQRQLKRQLFDWDDVERECPPGYHPGEEPGPGAARSADSD